MFFLCSCQMAGWRGCGTSKNGTLRAPFENLPRPRSGPDFRAILAGMDHRMTALERAFQLARSGQVSTVSGISASLKRDGYEISQIQGPALRRQLADLIRAARSEDANANRP